MRNLAKAIGALGFLAATPTFAQPAVFEPWDPGSDVIVREYATRAAPPAFEYHETLRPGSILPTDVPLRIFGADANPKLRGYAYFISVDDKLVVVEADTRRVVRIITLRG